MAFLLGWLTGTRLLLCDLLLAHLFDDSLRRTFRVAGLFAADSGTLVPGCSRRSLRLVLTRVVEALGTGSSAAGSGALDHV